MGRWSARHRKIAIFGWLALRRRRVRDRRRRRHQEPRRERHRRRRGRNAPTSDRTARRLHTDERREYVLVQSKTLHRRRPAFRAAVGDVDRTLGGRSTKVRNVRSPLDPAQRRPDLAGPPLGARPVHAKGDYDAAIDYIDTIAQAVDGVQSAHPRFTIDESGGASTGRPSTTRSTAARDGRDDPRSR